jgi:protein-S-isoprenylcysteine O-methyltransferase Ste14
MKRSLARWRVPLGFLCSGAALWLARPTMASVFVGLGVAIPGEALRIWAAGHLDKGREITTSGPYRVVRHPLYLGSAIIAAGFAIATATWMVALIAAGYLGLTYAAAIATEEATLDARFGGAYSAYREGRAQTMERSFSASRVMANREYRAVAGLIVAFGLLALKR